MSRRLDGFMRLEKYEVVLSKLLEHVKIRIGIEAISVTEATGRIAAEDVVSPRDYPPVDRAALDGYAVRSLDTSGASPSNPIPLKIVGNVKAGDVPRPTVGVGEAVVIFTGATMPRGSDAVVPFEEAMRDGDYIYVLKPMHQYKNVSRTGEDLKSGDLIVRRGTVIRPWHIAALIEAGVLEVKVFKRPKVIIISIGDELVADPTRSTGYTIPNSTGPLIYAYLRELGCEPVLKGVITDDASEIINSVSKSLDDCDIVITTGGTSVGGTDLTPDAISRIPGAQLVFHGVNIRPGRTAGAYVVGGKPVFMLSGLPVAALVGLEVFVKPLIRHLVGAERPPQPSVRARVRRRIANVVGFNSFFRVVVYREGGELNVEPLRLTGSGIVSSLLRGNAILTVSENVEGYDEGDYVDVLLIGPIYEGRPAFLDQQSS
ncbi:MAG: molybdopterin molybdotransferase MoeA [Zestosphaera sp.]